MNNIIKTSLMLAILATFFIFSQSYSKGGAMNAGKQSIAVTNVLTTKQLAWFVDEIDFHGEKDTNGWGCLLRVSNFPEWSSQRQPICVISINNISTNVIRFWVGYYFETYTKIELLNSSGQPVEKTVKGKQIGTQTDDRQIKELVKNRFQEWVNGQTRTPGYIPIHPGKDWHTSFGIPDLFDIKQSGDYVLKAQVCLIQKIGGEEYDPQLKITWLPQVTAKIQLRAGDISPGNPTSNGQTNLPAK